jgi:SAM-dependent methyltransferase
MSFKPSTPPTRCVCCLSTNLAPNDILWTGLIDEWGLSRDEAAYINRQQGFSCLQCGSSLRSMTLAYALTQIYQQAFDEFLRSNIEVLELNEAGHLNQFLKTMPHHQLAEYPEVDIMDLPYADNSYDLVIHSDTMEHVPDPVAGYRESLRVLKPGGFTAFTIPLVVGRLSKKRGKQPSYHGSPGNKEYLVQTEYGADMWTQLFEAGFRECRLISIEYPSSVAIVGRKPGPSAAIPIARKTSLARKILRR